MARELAPLVVRRVMDVGVYPAHVISRDHIAERILGAPEPALEVEDELIAGHLAPAAVHAATMALLRPPLPSRTPAQYAIFALAPSRLALLNLNTDGLADAYCFQHLVINLHGTSISVEHREALGWDSLIDALQIHPALRAPAVPGLILPQVEPPHLEDSPGHLRAKQVLLSADRIAIVGYSFGEMDDWIVHDMVVTAMRARPVQVVVASPYPSDLSTRLAEEAGHAVSDLRAYWAELAEAVLLSIAKPVFKSCAHRRLCARCTSYLYEGLLDQRNGRGTT